jgi:hypothetical protein
MGKCPNCGHKAWGLRTTKCKNCGKEICDKCGSYLFKLWHQDSPQLLDVWYACSQQCLQDFASRIENHLSPADVGLSARSAIDNIPFLVGKMLLGMEPDEYLSKDSARLKSKAQPFRVNFAPLSEINEIPKGNALWNRLEKYTRSMVIQNLITTENFEAAARLYEKMGMYEAAGKTRAMDKEIRIKKTEVSVDLNNAHEEKEGTVNARLTSQAPTEEFTGVMPIIGMKILATLGYVLTIASLFLPWATASVLFVSVSHTGFEFIGSDPVTLAVLVFLPILDCVLIWTKFQNLRGKGWSCIVSTFVLGFFAYLSFNAVQNWIRSLSTQVYARIDSGFYLLPAGVFIMFLSGILLLATKKTEASTRARENFTPKPRHETYNE